MKIQFGFWTFILLSCSGKDIYPGWISSDADLEDGFWVFGNNQAYQQDQNSESDQASQTSESSDWSYSEDSSPVLETVEHVCAFFDVDDYIGSAIAEEYGILTGPVEGLELLDLDEFERDARLAGVILPSNQRMGLAMASFVSKALVESQLTGCPEWMDLYQKNHPTEAEQVMTFLMLVPQCPPMWNYYRSLAGRMELDVRTVATNLATIAFRNARFWIWTLLANNSTRDPTAADEDDLSQSPASLPEAVQEILFYSRQLSGDDFHDDRSTVDSFMESSDNDESHEFHENNRHRRTSF